MKGLAYYCFKESKGCLVIGENIPKKLNKACTNCNQCQWEDIGSFKIVNRNLILSVPNQIWFDEMNSGWSIHNFKNNLYDQYMDMIDYHEVINDE
jgi:hypothetical protein